jgi:small-conductance mechanosensitive channel
MNVFRIWNQLTSRKACIDKGLPIALASVLLSAQPTIAQEPATLPADQEPAAETQGRANAGAALREIEQLLVRLGDEELVAGLSERLDRTEQQLTEEVAGRLQDKPMEQLDRSRLDSVLRLLPRYRNALTDLQRDLNQAIAVTESIQESLRQTEETWATILNNAERADLPPELAALIERVITEATIGRQLASERLGGLVAIETRTIELRSQLDSLVDEAEARNRALLADIFRRDSTPAWTALANFSGDSAGEGLAAASDAVTFGVRDLSNAHGSRLIGHVVAGLLLLIVLLIMRRNPKLTERIGSSATWSILNHPVALAIVLTLAFTQPLYPTAQPSVEAINAIVFICAELVLLSALLTNVRWWSLSLVGIYLVAMTAFFLLPFDSPLQRLTLIAGALGGIALMAATRRFGRGRIRRAQWRFVFDFVLIAFILLLITAIVGNTFGAVAYANFVLEAVLRSYLAALGLFTLNIVFRDFIEILLDTKLAGHLRSIQQSRISITLVLKKSITVIAVALWLWALLNAFRLLDPVMAAGNAAFDASWTVGQATISVGTIAVFVLSVWLAIYVSRVTRFFLDEDVLPRLNLPRGVPAAISTGTHYLIISGALVFGTAAAGLDLTKLAIVVGALSVGIGFGLQNIVNNFISGLILLFERPIQVGDHVQVGQLMGRVTRIGIRASTVRMYEGSEVIVPNGDLISQQVINHTLSDRDRRLELRVGVAYGTDLEKARDVIEGAVNSVSRISNEPPAQVLFTGFGDSSIDFRVLFWIDDFDVGLKTLSEVGMAISRELAREGIQIPFPQRDVHLHTLAPAGADAGKT